ncbi:MAG TPA: Gfo/Idh/MocA family oxidoreductase [Lacunisphaera sp.]|jgi:predicted dehydrogenase
MIHRSSQCPRIALIGVSGYGQIYLELVFAAQARGQLVLIAAVIINPREEGSIESRLRQQGCRIYRDYTEMLRAESGQLDLCLIPTGIPWHARMTIAALQAGANVLVEKPLAGSLAEVAAIRTAEHSSGKFVAVGFQDLYSPVNRWLKQQLHAGAIGRLHTVRFLGLWPRPASYFTRNDWAGRLHAQGSQVLDSPLNNAFAHFVILSLYFAGTELEAAASAQIESAELLRANAIESFDTSVVKARSAAGVAFWFGATHTCHEIHEPEIHLEGTDGRIEWKHEQSCTIIHGDGRKEERLLPDITANRQSMFAAVLKKIVSPETVVCSTGLAEHHTAFVEAVHAATRVQTVPAVLINWETPLANTPPVPVVRGLEAALLRAFADRSLLQETGFILTTPTAS